MAVVVELEHVQVHGPLPVTADVMPAEQRLVIGTTLKVLLLLLPQVTATGGTASKVAPTLIAFLTRTVQFTVPWHAPLHPVKREPSLDQADKVTLVFSEKLATQLLLHEMPDGRLLTFPEPVPLLLILSVYEGMYLMLKSGLCENP